MLTMFNVCLWQDWKWSCHSPNTGHDHGHKPCRYLRPWVGWAKDLGDNHASQHQSFNLNCPGWNHNHHRCLSNHDCSKPSQCYHRACALYNWQHSGQGIISLAILSSDNIFCQWIISTPLCNCTIQSNNKNRCLQTEQTTALNPAVTPPTGGEESTNTTSTVGPTAIEEESATVINYQEQATTFGYFVDTVLKEVDKGHSG